MSPVVFWGMARNANDTASPRPVRNIFVPKRGSIFRYAFRPMKRLRPSIVATVSLVALAGCQQPRDPNAAPESHNPPAPNPDPPPSAPTAQIVNPPPVSITSNAGDAATTPPPNKPPPQDDAAELRNLKRVLNESHPKHGTIMAGPKGCFVFGQWPDQKPRRPGEMPPTIDVACPPSMKDAAWKDCIGGTLSTNDGGDVCGCFVGGNPPPPERRAACPASAKAKK